MKTTTIFRRVEGLVFLCRLNPRGTRASAAPLRVRAGVRLDWELKVDIFKRRGPVHDGNLMLPSVPGGLSAVLTPRLRQPSRSSHPARSSAQHLIDSSQ